MKKKIKIVSNIARANPFYRSMTVEIIDDGQQKGDIATIAVCVAASGYDVFATYNGKEGEQNIDALQGRSVTAEQAAAKWREFCDFYGVA